jgi:prephenate dehydrogenase
VNKQVSIIGLGRFGRVLYEILKEDHFEITLYDKATEAFENIDLTTHTKTTANIEKVYQNSKTVFYCVPIPAFETVIEEHQKYFTDEHVLIDVLSVKSHPKKVFEKYLKDKKTQAILTHPMFGPDSVKAKGLKGLPMVMNQFKANDENYHFWKDYFSSKGISILEMKADKHDRLAANSQGLTHFFGRLLEEYGFEPTPIDTLGAKKLQKVMNQTCNDTWELFKSLQSYNPYTKDMRLKLGEAYDALYNKLLPERISKNSIVFGIQGGKGSFNEQALTDYVNRHNIQDYSVEYLYTTENVLKELHKGNIDFGQFAIHNSIGGIVTETIEAVADYKFEIVEKFTIIIAHFMMARPEVKMEDITRIMTHPQVLKQCKSNLEKKYPNLEKTSGEGELIDHANVAKALSENKLPQEDKTAVMGPQILSEIYNLQILDSNLQDNKENYTSFLMVERK